MGYLKLHSQDTKFIPPPLAKSLPDRLRNPLALYEQCCFFTVNKRLIGGGRCNKLGTWGRLDPTMASGEAEPEAFNETRKMWPCTIFKGR